MTVNVSTTAVRADGLSRRYGSIRALDAVDVTLDRGITGLLGPNGAGKTTLLSILATISEPDAGQVSVFGLDPRDAAERTEIRQPSSASCRRNWAITGTSRWLRSWTTWRS